MTPDPAPHLRGETSPSPTPPTPAQLAELEDTMVTAAELLRVYAALSRHPRVQATPGSNEIFASCREQMRHDLMLIEEQIDALYGHVRISYVELDDHLSPEKVPVAPPPRSASLPDMEPTHPDQSVFETVRKAFHLEDFLRQQVGFSLQSARDRQHLKLELELKMIGLSARQRCELLEERYGFARSPSVILRGLRRQTTRFLNRIHGEKRHDID